MEPLNKSYRVEIIAELHPQHSGDRARLQTMILQAKMAGADAVKVQLYDTQKLHGNSLRAYMQITKAELKDLKQYADGLGIELFASAFDLERVAWCEELGFSRHKIASRVVADKELCNAMIATGKPVLISLGMHDWQKEGFPYEADNLIYFFCVSSYPTLLEEIQMPNFEQTGFKGYSDHSLDIAASLFAVSRGARYVEKHFTLNKAQHKSSEKGHLGSMDFDELVELRKLADSLSQLHAQANLRKTA